MKKPGNDLYIEVGEYSYPFQLELPSDLPTSFEHEYGQIHYSINATIDIPCAFDKHSVKSFSVINVSDLNLLGSQIAQPSGLSSSRVFCCWCCVSEPVSANFESNFFLFKKIL